MEPLWVLKRSRDAHKEDTWKNSWFCGLVRRLKGRVCTASPRTGVRFTAPTVTTQSSTVETALGRSKTSGLWGHLHTYVHAPLHTHRHNFKIRVFKLVILKPIVKKKKKKSAEINPQGTRWPVFKTKKLAENSWDHSCLGSISTYCNRVVSEDHPCNVIFRRRIQ